jgi:hypothetical protein
VASYQIPFMEEHHWLKSADARRMLRFLLSHRTAYMWGPPSPRKLRLFAAACAFGETDTDRKNVWGDMELSFHEEAALAERMADEGLGRPSYSWSWATTDRPAEAARNAASCPNQNKRDKAGLLRAIFGNPFRPKRVWDEPKKCPVPYCDGYLEEREGNLAVCFGPWKASGHPPPFRLMRRSWLTDSALALAEGVYRDKDWGQMPLLADALEDAGCDDVEILHHLRGLLPCPCRAKEPRNPHGKLRNCRGCKDRLWVMAYPGPDHTRGDWALDLILGKE